MDAETRREGEGGGRRRWLEERRLPAARWVESGEEEEDRVCEGCFGLGWVLVGRISLLIFI